MVSFAAEPIFRLGFFSVTNTLLDTLIVDGVLVGIAIYIKKHLKLIPGFVQNISEYAVETMYNLTESVAPERAARIFPFFATFFIFILLANWSGLIPGFGTIGFYEGVGKSKTLVPLLRSATTDLNTTLGLALVSAVATHVISIKIIGIKEYLGRYFSINPMNQFIGFLEMISEITKIISLSFRLFGNIYAGEIVLGTIASIFAFIAPLPFLLLEFIVGFVQALVFAMLTMAFMAILSTPHHTEAKEVSHK
ncbi:MAG: F0F1 ATP synthase subunit A [Patescibacteria group bacterium]|nr:F0F1 ATP synthase subunit A [Patescibacteria group bacterium]